MPPGAVAAFVSPLKNIAMSVPLIIIILVILSLLLFALEAFVTPGFGVAGIAASACVVAADIMVYCNYGAGWAIWAVLLSTLLVLLFFWWLSRSKTLDRMTLHSTIDSTAATAEQLSVRPGDKGVALTRLALIGNADFGGKSVEVKSAAGFIDEGTPVVVTAVNEALVLVKPC